MFKGIIYFLAVIALITGAMDMWNGLAAQKVFGAGLTEAGFSDPMMDNVFRFLAAMWFGVGVQMIFFVRDLPRYKPALMLLLGIVILGGFARLLSMYHFGLPDASAGRVLIFAGLFAELIVAPILLIWGRRLKT